MKVINYPTILRYNPRTEEIKDIREGVREMKKLLAEAEVPKNAYIPKPREIPKSNK